MSDKPTNYEQAQALARTGRSYALLAVADELRLLREALSPKPAEVTIDPRAIRGIRPTGPAQAVQEALDLR